MYLYVCTYFQNTLVLVQNFLVLIKFWIFDKLLLLLFQGRDYETDEESEKTNEKEELSSEQ